VEKLDDTFFFTKYKRKIVKFKYGKESTLFSIYLPFFIFYHAAHAWTLSRREKTKNGTL
jgi:hypothetical protein